MTASRFFFRRQQYSLIIFIFLFEAEEAGKRYSSELVEKMDILGQIMTEKDFSYVGPTGNIDTLLPLSIESGWL